MVAFSLPYREQERSETGEPEKAEKEGPESGHVEIFPEAQECLQQLL